MENLQHRYYESPRNGFEQVLGKDGKPVKTCGGSSSSKDELRRQAGGCQPAPNGLVNELMAMGRPSSSQTLDVPTLDGPPTLTPLTWSYNQAEVQAAAKLGSKPTASDYALKRYIANNPHPTLEGFYKSRGAHVTPAQFYAAMAGRELSPTSPEGVALARINKRYEGALKIAGVLKPDDKLTHDALLKTGAAYDALVAYIAANNNLATAKKEFSTTHNSSQLQKANAAAERAQTALVEANKGAVHAFNDAANSAAIIVGTNAANTMMILTLREAQKQYNAKIKAGLMSVHDPRPHVPYTRAAAEAARAAGGDAALLYGVSPAMAERIANNVYNLHDSTCTLSTSRGPNSAG